MIRINIVNRDRIEMIKMMKKILRLRGIYQSHYRRVTKTILIHYQLILTDHTHSINIITIIRLIDNINHNCHRLTITNPNSSPPPNKISLNSSNYIHHHNNKIIIISIIIEHLVSYQSHQISKQKYSIFKNLKLIQAFFIFLQIQIHSLFSYFLLNLFHNYFHKY